MKIINKFNLSILIMIISTNINAAENIADILNKKKCVFTPTSHTFQYFNSNKVHFVISDEILAFNRANSKNYNIGYSQGSLSNIDLNIYKNNNEIGTTDQKRQVYFLCYEATKINRY